MTARIDPNASADIGVTILSSGGAASVVGMGQGMMIRSPTEGAGVKDAITVFSSTFHRL